MLKNGSLFAGSTSITKQSAVARWLFALACYPLLLMCSAQTACGQQVTVPKPVVEISSRWELFVDDWLIESFRDARLRLNTPVRQEVVLVTDKPWEGVDSAYYSVIHDGNRVRLYYRGYCPADADGRQVTCMAESADGIHFTRPNLGLYTFNGSKQNNIIWQGVEAHNFAPFLDTNPDGKPSERYKALAGINSKLYAFASPDGIHWRKLQADPVITEGTFDSLNTAFYDTVLHRYRCYSRYFLDSGYQGARAIQGCTSTDFVHWDKPQPNRYREGVPRQHFYTNATRPVPDAPHILVSFPKRFYPERTKRANYKEAGLSDSAFMSSRDGLNWERAFLEAWVRPGQDEKNWTQRSNMPAAGIVQMSPNEYMMYISEHYEWPDNRLRRLTLRKHGFASVHADFAGGEFTTRLIHLTGKHLVLNYATSAFGSVLVEILDAEGKPIEGFTAKDMEPLFGDEIEAKIRWKQSTLSSLKGKTVRLRLLLKDADIYALKLAEK